jgi:hypothetical protein
MTLLLFHLQQAYLAVQEAQDEVRRCADAARAFYGEAEWTPGRAIFYRLRREQLQVVMDALAAEGQLLQKGEDL